MEEQRVNAVIRFVDLPEKRANLGHGFRVEVRIVVWGEDDVSQLRQVVIGQNNGIQAEVIRGLEEGSRIILFPSSALTDAMHVIQRSIQ